MKCSSLAINLFPKYWCVGFTKSSIFLFISLLIFQVNYFCFCFYISTKFKLGRHSQTTISRITISLLLQKKALLVQVYACLYMCVCVCRNADTVATQPTKLRFRMRIHRYNLVFQQSIYRFYTLYTGFGFKLSQ